MGLPLHSEHHHLWTAATAPRRKEGAWTANDGISEYTSTLGSSRGWTHHRNSQGESGKNGTVKLLDGRTLAALFRRHKICSRDLKPVGGPSLDDHTMCYLIPT